MPRYPNYEQSVDDCLTFKLSKLKEWGYLENDVTFRTYIWSVDGKEIAKLGFRIATITEDLKQLTFDYSVNGKPIKYNVSIVTVPSNLGIGKRWYFVCPRTDLKCLNLICPNGSDYFYHRKAFRLLYESQKKSKRWASVSRYFDTHDKLSKAIDDIRGKYRKVHYRGKPTLLIQKIHKLKDSLDSYEKNNPLMI